MILRPARLIEKAYETLTMVKTFAMAAELDALGRALV